MSVSQSPAPSSIDLTGLPAGVGDVVAQAVAFCHEQCRSEPSPVAFEEAEVRVREMDVRAWAALTGATHTPVNNNISPDAPMAIAA